MQEIDFLEVTNIWDELLDRVELGGVILIKHNGKVVARLISASE